FARTPAVDANACRRTSALMWLPLTHRPRPHGSPATGIGHDVPLADREVPVGAPLLLGVGCSPKRCSRIASPRQTGSPNPKAHGVGCLVAEMMREGGLRASRAHRFGKLAGFVSAKHGANHPVARCRGIGEP